MNSFHTYSFPNAKNVVVCGDIHGEFNAVIYKLCVQYQMTDTVLIIAGDCGFGFDKPGYYDNVYNRNSSRLSKANNWVVMIRGNHDDPAYFQEKRIHHDRFRCVPDYSVIQACGHNILCVGGAISIDRDYRKKHDSRHSRSGVASYWTDEMPVYDKEKLDSISQELKIDTVITHTAPSFCELISKGGLTEWATLDPDIPDGPYPQLSQISRASSVPLVLRSLPPELEFRDRRHPILDAGYHGVQRDTLIPL